MLILAVFCRHNLDLILFMAKSGKKKITFSLERPEAHAVLLAGDFTGWEQAPITLKKQKSGSWKATVSLDPGTYEYLFLVDGQWLTDPACPERKANPYGGENCVREVL